MKKTTIISLSVAFVLIILGMFAYSYLQQDATSNPTDDTATTTPDTAAATPYDYVDRIDATHYYIDGVHTLVGQVTMPTPCDLLETDVQIQESYPETVHVNFSVINNADMCAQVMTEQRFMVEVEASPEANFTADLAGRSLPLNLIPAPEGETPEEYELYQKG